MSAARTLLRDTWRGLIQRRLWPVAVLLLAALVALPVALRADPDPAPAPARDQVAGDSAELAPEPIVAVASASERETVRRVLGRRKDPFRPTNQPKRKKAKAASTGSASGGASADDAATPADDAVSGSSSGATTTVAPVAPIPTTPSATPDHKRPARAANSLTIRWGSSEEDELGRGDVERLDALPSAEEPVVIYLGLTANGRKAIFMIEAGATAVGDGRCRPDPSTCETVELAEGETEFFDVEDEDGNVAQYQLDLVRIHARKAKATGASTAHRARAARSGDSVARLRSGDGKPGAAARAALRALRAGDLGFRYDEETGRLERLGDES